jgi:hypothetical protein
MEAQGIRKERKMLAIKFLKREHGFLNFITRFSFWWYGLLKRSVPCSMQPDVVFNAFCQIPAASGIFSSPHSGIGLAKGRMHF